MLIISWSTVTNASRGKCPPLRSNGNQSFESGIVFLHQH